VRVEGTHVRCVETTFALIATCLRTRWYIIARLARVIQGDLFKDNQKKGGYYCVNGRYLHGTGKLNKNISKRDENVTVLDKNGYGNQRRLF